VIQINAPAPRRLPHPPSTESRAIRRQSA